MNRVLIVVDYQNDFVDGALGFEGADAIEENILDLIQDFKNHGDMIMFTKDTHEPNYMETVEGKHLPVIHCVKGTPGHDLRKRVDAVKEYYPIFEKPTFPSLKLGNALVGLPLSEIHLCGLVSDICVFSNAIMAKAACPNAEIYIHRNASASYDPDMEQKTYEVAEHLHINIID